MLRAFLYILVLLPVLTACGHRSGPDVVVLPAHCEPLSGAQSFTTVATVPRTGLLVMTVEQRGISATVTVGDTTATSPIERFGFVTNASDVRGDDRVTLRVDSRDSAEISGEICLSARLVDRRSDLARPERDFAAAGRAVLPRDWDKAFSLYASAARDFDPLASGRAAAARHAMGELAYRVYNTNREAQLLAREALRGYPSDMDAGLRSSIISLQAKAALAMSDARVSQLLDESERQARLAKYGAREIPRLNILRGFVEYMADRLPASTALFEKAADECKAMKDWECYARARQNLGAMAEETRNYADALKAYDSARENLAENVAPELSADIWGNIGRLQSRAGLIRPSAESLGNAMRLYAEIGNCDGARRSLVNLGRLLVQVGSVEDALDYLRRGSSTDCATLLAGLDRDVAAISPDIETPERTAGTRERRALQQSVCDAPLAPASLTRDGKFVVFVALLALNELLLLEEETTAATKCLNTARQYIVSNRDQLRFATAEGATELRRGQTKDAGKAFARAEQIVETAGLSATQLFASRAQLGRAETALAEGHNEEAVRFARLALESSAARGEVSQMIGALQLLAAGLRASKDVPGATRTLEVAVSLSEQVPIDELDGERRATYLATQHAVFSELTDLLIASADNEAATWSAFLASERGRSRSLRFAATQTERSSVERDAATTSQRYEELVARVTDPAISDGTGVSLPDYIERLGALVASQTTGMPAAGANPLLAQLARLDASFIEYSVGRDAMFAFVVNGGQLRVVRLGGTQRIADATESLYERIRDPEAAPSDVRRATRALAELVLWPLREHITRSRLVIVPEDSLHSVPFAALPWSEGEESELLVQRLEPVIVPSAAFLHRPPARSQQATASMVLFGDPIFRTNEWRRECLQRASETGVTAVASTRSMSDWASSLPRLPATRAEVLNIAALARHVHPGSDVKTELGCAATRSALRKAVDESPEILHVATHGFVDAHRPRLSALALSRESEKADERAIFTLMDILDSKLDARLVVLSACETSRGRLLPGEGVLGPAQAFLQSGAASVLASHWRIADEETSDFMQAFYRNLLQQRLPAASALRRAQLDQLDKGVSVSWAAFSLYGWPDISFK